MPELPASVRVALWVTASWRSGEGLEPALDAALPDVDAVGPDVHTLEVWHDLGESTVLVALPSSGDVTGLPAADPEAVAEAVDAEEALLAPGLGAMLIPRWSTFGAPGARGPDAGARLDWTAHVCQPVPRHRVEALDPRETMRVLTEQVVLATTDLDRLGGRPFDATAARDGIPRSRHWALPEGLPAGALRAITFAAAIGTAATAGLEGPQDAVDGHTLARRTEILRRLERDADRALADATNAGVVALAQARTSR